MATHSLLTPEHAVQQIKAGRVIAYPTEAVFGLGCDPWNETAVKVLFSLKGRSPHAGLILIADDFKRFNKLIAPQPAEVLQRALDSWPGHVTWLFPRSEAAPEWICGRHPTIALRVTAHPVCREICALLAGPLVSTSANPSGAAPARTAGEVEAYFDRWIAGIVAGALGGQTRPSEIRDLASGQVVRGG